MGKIRFHRQRTKELFEIDVPDDAADAWDVIDRIAQKQLTVVFVQAAQHERNGWVERRSGQQRWSHAAEEFGRQGEIQLVQ